MVMVMSTNCQPSGSGTVHRKQKDGSSVEVPCPESILWYNTFMGEVDRADQLCGYNHCRSKSRNFYKYIFFFLFDVAITNAFILMKNFASSCPFKDFKSFRLQLTKDLIGEYCSHPFWHYPVRLDDDDDRPRYPRGPCALHRDIHYCTLEAPDTLQHHSQFTTWYCLVILRIISRVQSL